MGLQQLLRALRDDLRLRGHASTYLARRASSVALTAYLDLDAVVVALDDDAPETFAERELLLRALLTEHRRAARTPPHSSTWAATLIVAFAPMLGALRGRLRGEALPPDELDQLVLEGFLDALERCPLEAASLCARLHFDTRRFVIRALVREQRRQVAQRALEARARQDDCLVLFEWRTRPAPLDAEEADELAELLRAVAGDAVAPSRLQVVISTRLHGRPLQELAGAEGGRSARGYARLKRERSRTLELLRPLLLARLSPPEGDLALDLMRPRAAS